MLDSDQYKTIAVPSEGIYKEKGSKFIAFAYPIFSEVEFKEKRLFLRKEFHDARHHCYAFRLGANLQDYRFNDDGEPNNSAGKPIYGQIQSFELTNIGIVVVRYFGGTKLGVGGLVSAYKEAAKTALSNAQIITKTVTCIYELNFGYEIMSDVMNFIKKNKLHISAQNLEEKGCIHLNIRKNESEKTIHQLTKIDGLKITFLKVI